MLTPFILLPLMWYCTIAAPTVVPSDLIFNTSLENNCKCGVFNSKTVTSKDVPLMVHAPLKLSCDKNGADDCNNLCRNLAMITRNGPELLCSVVKFAAEKLQPSIFSRVCDEYDWSYTNVTALEPFCCHAGKLKDC